MKTLLQLNSSIFSANGQSSKLADQYVDLWQAHHPDGQVISRDLAHDPMPHLNGDHASAFFTSPEARTPEQKALVDFSDTLIDELKQADVIVIGLPMYNLGIPSTLKAYFDQIARANITFRYTENGPVGLLKNKTVRVFATRGGAYVGTALDTQTNYVRNFLGFLGLTEVEFVYAENLNRDEPLKEAALIEAKQRLMALAA